MPLVEHGQKQLQLRLGDGKISVTTSLKTWKQDLVGCLGRDGRTIEGALMFGRPTDSTIVCWYEHDRRLQCWDYVTQKSVWEVEIPGVACLVKRCDPPVVEDKKGRNVAVPLLIVAAIHGGCHPSWVAESTALWITVDGTRAGIPPFTTSG